MQRRPAIGRSGRSRLAAMFVLLALLRQAWLVQAHFHSDPRPAPGLGTGIEASGRTHPAPLAPPACPLCEEQALFGSYVAAGLVTLAPPPALAAWYGPQSFSATDRPTSSHIWRSRAPPARSILPIT